MAAKPRNPIELAYEAAVARPLSSQAQMRHLEEIVAEGRTRARTGRDWRIDLARCRLALAELE